MKEYKYSINGNEYNVAIIDLDGTTAAVEVNGTSYKVDILTEGFSAPAPRPVAKPVAAAPAPAPVAAPAPTPAPVAAPAAPAASGTGKPILSPLPGVILDLKVNVGDQVKAGQTVAILEAMKMENNINAEADGTVTAIRVSKGDSILEGAEILFIG